MSICPSGQSIVTDNFAFRSQKYNEADVFKFNTMHRANQINNFANDVYYVKTPSKKKLHISALEPAASHQTLQLQTNFIKNITQILKYTIATVHQMQHTLFCQSKSTFPFHYFCRFFSFFRFICIKTEIKIQCQETQSNKMHCWRRIDQIADVSIFLVIWTKEKKSSFIWIFSSLI